MRCPKCGYISFDHNQICPKCNKDISDEQAKLNLPTYKSSPPALLGMLVGAGDESNVGFTLDSDAALRNSGMGLDFEEASSMLGSSNIDFGEGDQDLEISLNNDTGEFELPEISMNSQSGDTADIDLSSEDEELSLDMDEVSFKDSDDTADDLGLDLGEVSMGSGDEDGGVSDSLDGISPNDSIVLSGMADLPSEGTEETMEMGSIPREGKKFRKDGQSTVELNVSDLKINETGELEINSIPDEIYSPKSLPEEDEVKIDKIDVDSEEDVELETSSDRKKDKKNKTGSLELSDISLNASDEFTLDEVIGSDTAEIPVPKNAAKGARGKLNLGDLAINDDTAISETLDMDVAAADEEGLDLGDLAIEAGESMELSGLSFDDNETGELKASDFEENMSGEDSSFDSEKTVGFDDSLNIDLENLDLDLDLDDVEDTK